MIKFNFIFINIGRFNMEKEKIEEIEKEVSRYALTPKLLNEFLLDLKESINENSNFIMGCNREDVKSYKKQIKIKELLSIIETYKNSECLLSEDERKIIIYKGDPYLTLHICLQALIRRNKVLLCHEEFMLGVNEVIVKLFNKLLKEYKIFNLIDEVNKYTMKDIEKLKSYYDEIIVIGDTTSYQLFEDKKVKFYPYNNLILYCDTDELEKLQEAIYIYANENYYEIEILYEDNVDNVINFINSNDFVNIAVLLTKSQQNKEKFESEIKNKEIYVNENPFKNEVGKIYNYF